MLIPPDDPPAVRRRRIWRGIVRELLAFVLLTLFAPLLLLCAVPVDLALWLRRRKPWMAVRLARARLVVPARRAARAARRAAHVAARRRAVGARHARRDGAGSIASRSTGRPARLDGVRRLLGLRFEVEGDELVGRGPMIVLYRHASIVDNALPAVLISRPHGIDLRYVLKDELQALPTLDIGARWVPTCFVHRGSADPGARDRPRPDARPGPRPESATAC